MPRLGRLLVWTLLAAIATATGTAAPLLLAVGHVTSHSARILYDRVPPAARLQVRIYASESQAAASGMAYELAKELALPDPEGGEDPDPERDPDRPKVLALEQLRPDCHHIVAFRIADRPEEEEQVVRFRTARSPDPDPDAEAPGNRVLVVSCDRFVDDRDSTLWYRIVRDMEQHAATYFGMAHIGDQVYVDAGPDRVRIDPVPDAHRKNATWVQQHYAQVVADFRRIYRTTFGREVVQQVLRTGAHWMLPDDHEIINNFNAEFVGDVFDPPRNETEAARAKRFALELHYRAGLQVMYEFQYQLMRDVAWDKIDFLHDALAEILDKYPLYYDVEIEHLKLFFLDVRFDRSFTKNAEEAPLLVTHKQTQQFKKRMDAWRQQSDRNAAVVLTGMPLFFHSPLSARLAYKIERELYPGYEAQRRGLEDLFHLFQTYQQAPHPLLRLLIGGDAHTLVHSRVCGYSDVDKSSPHAWQCLDQLITSGVTAGSTAMNDTKLMPFYYWITRLQPLVDRASSIVKGIKLPWILATDRLFFGRNYGVVELSSTGEFSWNSGTAPHETWQQVMTQWMADYALLPSVISMCFLLLFGACMLLRLRRSQHAKAD